MEFLQGFNPLTHVLKHEVVNLTIANGSNKAIGSIDVREGEVIGVLADTDGTEKANNNMCYLGIQDGRRQYHEEPVSIEFYKKPANGYSGIRPLQMTGGQKLYAEVSTLKNVTAATQIQVVFIVKQQRKA